MNIEGVDGAVATVTAVAAELDLPTSDVTVLHNSNKLALRLLPCDVFARVAQIGQEVAAFEIDLAQQLTAVGAPVAALDARVAPQVYERDGYAITWWTYYDPNATGQLSPAHYSQALERLHAGLRAVDIAAPHFFDRVDEAEQLVASREQTPSLDREDRRLLLDTFSSVRRVIASSGAAEQLLHGEPHAGNILDTTPGPRFIDLETCCVGPIEFDVAHAPLGVGAVYPDLDRDLLGACRQLVLAMVAAWRYDVRDEFPDGRRHGQSILALLSDGPPWPALSELNTPAQ